MTGSKIYVVSVGINKYKTPGNDLEGCVNDSNRMVSLLREKYGAIIVQQLKDSLATTAGIRNALRQLVLKASESATLVFHYSGHGSRVKDLDGDDPSGFDDIICPHDLDWDDPITDDELYRTFLPAFKSGADVVMLMDCCHSGTSNRDLSLDNLLENASYAPLVPPEQVPISRFIRAPDGWKPRADASKTRSVKAIDRDIDNRVATLLSGCQDTETSADAWIPEARTRYGAYTYYLCQLIESKPVGSWTYGALVKQLTVELKKRHFSQTPNLNPNTVSIQGMRFLGRAAIERGGPALSHQVVLRFEGGKSLDTLSGNDVKACWEEAKKRISDPSTRPAQTAKGDISVSCHTGSSGWGCSVSIGGHF